jgi:hypothetical protein
MVQLVHQLATGWTVCGSNSGGGEIFQTCPNWPCGPLTLVKFVPGLCLEGRVAGVWRWPPTPI